MPLFFSAENSKNKKPVNYFILIEVMCITINFYMEGDSLKKKIFLSMQKFELHKHLT